MIIVLHYRIRKNIPFLKRIFKKRRLSYDIQISKRFSEQIKRRIENGESIGDIFHKYNKMSFILEYGYELFGKLLYMDDFYNSIAEKAQSSLVSTMKRHKNFLKKFRKMLKIHALIE